MKFEIQGLIAPPCTPMNEDGTINLASIAEYARYLKEKQCVNNLFVLGTTGEGQNLTVEERKLVAEEWMRSGRLLFDRIIIHIGAGNLTETQQLAKHAQKIKADAVAIAPPTYFKPSTVEQLGDYLSAVAETIPDVPVLYYHLPALTGANFTMMSLLDIVVGKIPNFAGMKFVSFLLPDFGRCQRKYGDRVALSYGKDEALVFAAMMGGTSFVGAIFNYAGKMASEMFQLYKAGDIKGAVEKQQDLQEIQHQVGNKGNLKSLTAQVSGILLGPTRQPIPRGESGKEIKQRVESTGLINFN